MISPDLSCAEFRKSSFSGTGNDCVEVAGNLPSVVAQVLTEVASTSRLRISSSDRAPYRMRVMPSP